LQWGFFLLAIGARCSQLAIAWWALAQTGSVNQLSLMVGSAMAAEALSKPLLGWLGDTYRKISIVQLGNLTVLASSVFIVWLSTLSEFHILPLTLAMMVIGTIVGIQDPIQGSMIPEFVSDQLVARAFRSKAMLWSMALVMGPALAGFLLSSVGVWATLATDAVAIATATLLSFSCSQHAGAARDAHEMSGKRRCFNSRLRSEFSIVFKVRMERYLAIFAMAINFLLAPFFAVIIPVYVKEVAMLPPWYAGLIDACFGIGILLGSRALPIRMQALLPRDRMIMLGFLMLGANVLALGLNLPIWLQPAFFLLGGVGLVWVNMNTSIVRSLATPAHFRNRMMAISGS
jgi:MFS family permease